MSDTDRQATFPDAPTWSSVLDAARRIQEAQKPDDIVAFYMAQSTFDVVKRWTSHGQSLRSMLAGRFGLPVHIDNGLDHMVLDGAQRDGTRRQLSPTTGDEA